MYYEVINVDDCRRIYAFATKNRKNPANAMCFSRKSLIIWGIIFFPSLLSLIFSYYYEYDMLAPVSLIFISISQIVIIVDSRKKIINREYLKPRWDIYLMQSIWAISLIFSCIIVF